MTMRLHKRLRRVPIMKEWVQAQRQMRTSVERSEALVRLQEAVNETQVSRNRELVAEVRAVEHQLASLVRRVDELAPYVTSVTLMQRQVLDLYMQLRNGSNAKKKRRPKR